MKNLSIVCLALLLLASCSKREESVAVESVSLPSTASVVVNGTLPLKAAVFPLNATDKSLIWATDKSDVVVVDQNGVLTGKSAGKTIITATSKSNSDKFAKCEVTVVTEKVTSITIAPENPVVLKGKTIELKATVLPADATQLVTWSSRDITKATIDPLTGVATGAEVGTTIITASATDGSGLKKEITLTVQIALNTPAFITGITLGAEEFVVRVPEPGATTTLSNAPATIAANLDEVQVNITATNGTLIKIGTTGFTSKQKVNFTNPVTFSVTEEGKTGSTEYTLAITPYNKDSNPYGIYTMAHLHNVRHVVSAGFKLMNDVVMPVASAKDTGIDDYASMGWLPIGGEENPFTGSLDGGGNKIVSFFIDRGALYIGLFGKVGSGASIKNMGVNGRGTVAVKGTNAAANVNQYTGMLAGYSEGTIENCHTIGNVSASSSSPFDGVVAAGGLVGYAKGAISSCYTTGNVSARSDANPESAAGGLAGFSEDATITGCYTNGRVYSYTFTRASSSLAGGLVGNCKNSTLGKCYATGDISSVSSSTTDDKGAYGGGLIGRLSTNSWVDNSYALGTVSVSVNTANSFAISGGLVGRGEAGCSVSNSYAVGNVSSSTARDKYTGGLIGNRANGTFTNPNCYRNSNASLKWGDNVVESNDNEFAGLTAKPLADMKKDAFKGNLNQGQSTAAWGQSTGKNSDLPFLIGVGEGK